MDGWVWSNGGMILTVENRNTGRISFVSATLFATNPRQTYVVSSPALRFDIVATYLPVKEGKNSLKNRTAR